MRTKLGLIALQRYMHVVHVLTLDTKCMSFVCDGKPFLRVLVVGKKVNTSLQEGLDLWIAGSCLLLQEDRGQHL